MDDAALLELVYRSRPETVAELAAISHLDEADVLAAVARLARRGSLAALDGNLSYPHPAVWAADEVTGQVASLRQASADALVAIEAIVAGLPSSLRNWSAGEASGGLVPVLARHGPQAAEDLWYAVAQRDGGHAEAVLPDVARFLHGDAERRARFAEAFGRKDSVRAILPTAAMTDPALRALAAGYAEVGVEFRMMEQPPSWFWIEGEMLAIPFEWGEEWPTSVLGLRSAALASLGRALFDQLWQRADPLTPMAEPWTPLLKLMRQGNTLDAASHRLGINPRTGRRRVAAAMEHYGVSTLFALGVAWAADGSAADGSPADRSPADRSPGGRIADGA
jgi:hypothetical protein